MGYRPSHRDPNRLQPEICAVTGRLVPADDLIVSDVEGLRGYACSSIAPELSKQRVNPSFTDLRQFHNTPQQLENEIREVPGCGENWWKFPEGLLADDTSPILGDDGEAIETD